MAINMTFWQLLLVYILLLIVAVVFKCFGINQTKNVFLSTLRMSIQLLITGFILTYIFNSHYVILTILYLGVMIGFAIYNICSKNHITNRSIITVIAIGMGIPGLLVLSYFLFIVLHLTQLQAQYAIPLFGMIMGNTMNAVSLAFKTFYQQISNDNEKIITLLGVGIKPVKILNLYIKSSVETAILPTINSMIAMGVVSLPGMMSGQLLAGSVPILAIFYQISIMVCICASVCLASIFTLYFSTKHMINKQYQIINIIK